MTTVTDLACTVTLGGVSQSGHIIACKRTGNLVEAHTAFEVTLDGGAGHPTVGAAASITESGTLVLTGNIDSVHYGRQPEGVISVQGRDNFWRVEDFFIDDPLLQAQGETVATWVGTLCGLCGMSYTLPAGDGAQPVGSPTSPVSLGMVFVIDSLRQLCALPGWSMRLTAAGVLEFVVLPDSGAADEVFTQLAGGNRTLSDQYTRNVAKIWGFDTNGNELLYQDRVAIAGIAPDRIMLVSTPNIQTLAQAQALTAKLLAHFGNLDEIADLTLPQGSPTRRLGMIGQATIESGHPQRSVLTDLESTVDASGYQQAMSLGRKNFYLPYYPPGNVPLPILMVLDFTGRVFVTLNWGQASPVWFENSTGLAGTVKAIVADQANGLRAYAMTSSGFYRCLDITNPASGWTQMLSTATMVSLFGTGSTNASPTAITCNPSVAGEILVSASMAAGAHDAYGALFYSIDGGATWAVGTSIHVHAAVLTPQIFISGLSFRGFTGEGTIAYFQNDTSGSPIFALVEFTGIGTGLSAAALSSAADLASAATTLSRGGAGNSLLAFPFVPSGGAADFGYTISRILASGPIPFVTGPSGFSGQINNNAVSADGLTGLALSSNSHVWSLALASATRVDLGLTSLTTAKCIAYLKGSSLILAAAGSGAAQSTDGGLSWTTLNGNLLSLIATPNLVSMDHIG